MRVKAAYENTPAGVVCGCWDRVPTVDKERQYSKYYPDNCWTCSPWSEFPHINSFVVWN